MNTAFIRSLFLAIAVPLISTACGDDPMGPKNPGPTGPTGLAKAAAVIVTPGNSQLRPGQSTTLTAEVRDSSDAVIEDAVVQWSSDDPTSASVNSAGVVRALREGRVTITASSGSASGDARITVNIVTVCECAVIIDSTNLRLVSRDSASGRFEFQLIDGEMPIIDTTKVIVGAQDEGFLRHVNAVENTGSTLVLETNQAGLADVIDEGGFGGSTRIFADEESGSRQTGAVWWGQSSVVYMAEGVREVRPGVLNLSGVKVGLGGDSIPVDFEFAVEDGALNFGPTLDLGAEIGLTGLKEFHAIYTGGLSLTAFDETNPLEYSIKVSKELLGEKAEKVLIIKRKPFLYFAGPVPIAGVLVFTVKAVAEATATGAIVYKGHFGAGFELSAGARYDGSNWSPVFGTRLRWDGRPPPPLDGLSGEVEAKVSFTARPELFLKFYGVAGPFVNVSPTLEAPAQLSVPGFDWSARVDYVTPLGIGMRVRILEKQPKKAPVDFTALQFGVSIPLHRPIILAEVFSNGPLVVTDNTTGDDLDKFYDVELTPAFNVNDALLGFSHDASTSTVHHSEVGSQRMFSGLRSGDSHQHRVRLDSVQGNCTVQSTAYDTVAIRSKLGIALVGQDTARVAFQVKCIPFGGVRVAAATTGPDQDPDGYVLAMKRIDTVGDSPKWFDNGAELPIGIGGQVLIDSLIPQNPDPRSRATGEHAFSLEEVRKNCAVARPKEHGVVILSGDTLFTSFNVNCIALGSVTVRTLTIDADPPPASAPITYSMLVSGEDAPEDSPIVLGSSDEQTIGKLIPLYSASGATGHHDVELSEPSSLPDRCLVEGGLDRRPVTVLSGETAEVTFDIECVERLHVRTQTTGAGTDADGYLVTVEPEATPDDTLLRPIGGNATIAIAGTTPGQTTIRLTDISPNCRVDVDAIDSDISASDSTLVTFSIDCPSGSVVRDSVVYAFEDVFVSLEPGRLEAVLGTFAVPEHRSEFGVVVSVDVLRNDDQPDEAFAIGTMEGSGPSFIGLGLCPVVPDGMPSGRAWVAVGVAALQQGDREFVARHGTEFECYTPVGDLSGPNSVHFFGLKLVYWRNP